MKKEILFVTFIVAFLSIGKAQATLIGFAADPSDYITDYAGFNWTGASGDFSWVNGTVNPLSSAPSAPLGYAWSNGGADLEFSLASPGTFSFNSFGVYADSSLWGGSSSILTIEGYSSGILVETFSTPSLDGLLRDVFTDFILNWSNIDTVKFSEIPNQNILLTNLDLEINSVPEPSILALLSFGLFGIGVARRKA